MAHNGTVLGQFLKLVSRHEFERERGKAAQGTQAALDEPLEPVRSDGDGPAFGRCSLRDIESNLDAQAHKLYHLGVGRVARSSLARVNERQPHELYEALFGRLLARCGRRRRGMVSGSATSCSRSMRRTWTCAWTVSLGAVPQDEGSVCTWGDHGAVW